MAFKKTRFPRRRSRKGAKRNVQSLSLCQYQNNLFFGPDGNGNFFGTCKNPVAVATPLAHGGTQYTSGNTPQGAPGLSSESTRGTSVRSIQFDLGGWATPVTFTAPAVTDAISIVLTHYFAIVKAEFDTFTYMNGGFIVPTWARVPNIIYDDLSTLVGTAVSPVFEREEDIFFRGMEEVACRNSAQCARVPKSESCDVLDPHTIVASLGVDSTADLAMARHYNLRHVKLKTGRFLRANEALFWVDNWVSSLGQSSFAHQAGWSMSLYGSLTTRVAR